jgi:hypothetical protein
MLYMGAAGLLKAGARNCPGWAGQEDDKLPGVGVWRRVAVIRRRATHDKVRKAVAVHVRSIETNDVLAGKR